MWAARAAWRFVLALLQSARLPTNRVRQALRPILVLRAAAESSAHVRAHRLRDAGRTSRSLVVDRSRCAAARWDAPATRAKSAAETRRTNRRPSLRGSQGRCPE